MKVLTQLDYEKKQVHTLKILAFDGQAFAQTKVVINVIDTNDNLLTASQACFEARVKENKMSDDSLITVQGMYLVVTKMLYSNMGILPPLTY